MDFTYCKRVLGKAYSGANGKKIAVEYNGKRYMLKFPPSGKNKPTELSYTNSCFSEYSMYGKDINNKRNGVRKSESQKGRLEN